MTKDAPEPDMPAERPDDATYPPTLRLTLEDPSTVHEQSLDRLKTALAEEGPADEAVRAFQRVEDLRDLLTSARLEMMRVIVEESPESIQDLADKLGREYSPVHQDVKTLADHGVVHFKTGSYGAKQPVIPYKTVRLDVPLVGGRSEPPSKVSLSEQEPAESGEPSDELDDEWFERAEDPREKAT